MSAEPLILIPEIDLRYANFDLSIRPSRIHRWGVFAEEKIPPRRKVIEYTGEKIARREVKRRSALRQLVYLFELNSYWCIDGAVGGSGAEYVNHCCDPNLTSSIMKGHILYFSRRAIEPGEELTLDYRFGANVERVNCYCGVIACRGTINLNE
jgi:uncharacterized protein